MSKSKRYELLELERKIAEWEKMRIEAKERMLRKKERAKVLGIDYKEYSHYQQAEQEYDGLTNAINDAKAQL